MNPMYSQPMDEGWKISFIRKPLVHSKGQKLFVNTHKKKPVYVHASLMLPFCFRSAATIVRNGLNFSGRGASFYQFHPPQCCLDCVLVFHSNKPLYYNEMLWQPCMTECLYENNVDAFQYGEWRRNLSISFHGECLFCFPFPPGRT